MSGNYVTLKATRLKLNWCVFCTGSSLVLSKILTIIINVQLLFVRKHKFSNCWAPINFHVQNHDKHDVPGSISLRSLVLRRNWSATHYFFLKLRTLIPFPMTIKLLYDSRFYQSVQALHILERRGEVEKNGTSFVGFIII